MQLLSPTANFTNEKRTAVTLLNENGQRLTGVLHEPLQDHQTAVVLLIPGWSGPRTGPAELLLQWACGLVNAGLPVYRTDLHGRGDAEGDYYACDLDRMIADVTLGVNYLEERFPRRPIYLGGICSGGNVALGVASLYPHRVSGIVGLSVLPFQPARDASFDRKRKRKNLRLLLNKLCSSSHWLKLLRGEVNLKRVRENLSGSEKHFDKTDGRNLKDSSRNIEAALQDWPGRLLLIWGGGDAEGMAARPCFEQLFAQSSASVTYEIVAGANHNFYGKLWRNEIFVKALRFIAETR